MKDTELPNTCTWNNVLHIYSYNMTRSTNKVCEYASIPLQRISLAWASTVQAKLAVEADDEQRCDIFR